MAKDTLFSIDHILLKCTIRDQDILKTILLFGLTKKEFSMVVV
jgi:hypothetical protein